jgi:hypothetical protein
VRVGGDDDDAPIVQLRSSWRRRHHVCVASARVGEGGASTRAGGVWTSVRLCRGTVGRTTAGRVCAGRRSEVRASRWAGEVVCTKDGASVRVGKMRARAHDGIGGARASDEVAGRTHAGHWGMASRADGEEGGYAGEASREARMGLG